MGNKRIVGSVAALVIVAAAGWLWLSLIGLPPPVDVRPHEALGRIMAQEALKQLGSGGRVILIRRDTATFKNPAVDAQLASFQRTLRKAGTSIAATSVIKVDPLRVVSVPSGDYLQILRKAAETDVVVSFLGPPVFSAEQLSKLGGKIPKVVAVCSGAMPAQVDLKRAFELKLLQAAVLSRADASATPPALEDPQAWFDHYFVLATSPDMLPSPTAPERK